MARKTPGIYIAIRGDYSAFETDLNAAKKLAKVQGDAIAKSINNAVSAVDLTGGINKLTRELKTAQVALSAGSRRRFPGWMRLPRPPESARSSLKA